MNSFRFRFLFITVILSIFFLPGLVTAQSRAEIRIATYDLLQYSEATTERQENVRKIIAQIDPDILVVQKLSGAGAQAFISASWNQPGVQAAPSNDSANGLFYNDQAVTYISHRSGSSGVVTGVDDYDEWVLAVRTKADTLHIFCGSFDPGDDDQSRSNRARLGVALRAQLIQVPESHHYMLVGAVNVYDSSEQAYQALTQPGTFTPNLIDPLGPGDWHDNQKYAAIHTQSTRVRTFGGGAGGGLDDRWDFILCSQSLIDEAYIQGSYTVFGNDGQHFNDSINRLPNLVVTDDIANALYNASDHLPVYANFGFARQYSSVPSESGAAAATVTAKLDWSDRKAIFTVTLPAPARVGLRLYNLLGKEVASLQARDMHAGANSVAIDLPQIPRGQYYYILTAPGYQVRGKVQ